MVDADPSPAVNWDKAEPSLNWHPDIRALFLHWRAVHPGHGLSGRRHLDPAAIAKLLPGVWLLDVQASPFRLRYRLVGTKVVHGIGREVTGQWLDEAHPEAAATPAYLERYRRVVESGIPSWRRGRPQLSIHLDFDTIENLILPLAEDGTHLDMLLAMTVFHREPPQETELLC